MLLDRLKEVRAIPGLSFALGVAIRVVFWPTVAAAVVAGVLKLTGLSGMSPLEWLVATPLLYFCWLLVVMSCYALETTLLGPLLVKPRRLVTSEENLPLYVALIFALYMSLEYLFSVPGARWFRGVPGFRWLWHRAYAPSVHLAHTSTIRGIIADPDLTFVGQGAVIGEETRLVAHSVSRLPQGEIVIHTAPIRIGRNVTIGGGCQLEMGVHVGAGALIEPFSHLLAFTKVRAGEVWGGAPAVFRRRRDEAAVTVPETGFASPASVSLNSVLRLVAHALSLPPDEITAQTDSANCPNWDSVGKMAISAALHDRFGFSLTIDELVQLNSVASVIHSIEARKHSAAAAKPGELPACAELLPLLPLAPTTALLAEKGMHPSPGSKKPLRICVAASFVAEPLASALRLWCHAFGIEAEITFAGFNQLQAALLSPESLFHDNRAGLNVLLTRPEDLMSENGDTLHSTEQLLTAIERFSARAGRSLLVGNLPPVISRRWMHRREEAAPIRLLWSERLASLPRVDCLDFTSLIEELGVIASRDETMESEASTPYSPAIYQRLGIAISRFARRQCLPCKKVAAVDADGVLWGGVVGEDGPRRLDTGGAFPQLQQQLLTWKEQGVLLALVSRNEPADVWAAFDAHPEMPLQREDFAAVAINWKNKSENLRAIASELNLCLDSFVFIDDNPAEQLEVQASCPDVTVVPIPSDAGHAVTLLGQLWCFDASATSTAEDRRRTSSIQAEAQRKASALPGVPYQEYLRSLELSVEVRVAEAGDLARVAQLTQKTNQFNLSLRRRTLGEVEALALAGPIWIVRARDRFDDYGIVGVGILEPANRDGDIAVLDTFLLSCRALGRGIEEAFLHSLCLAARQNEAVCLLAPSVTGPRNQPVRDFFLRQGWSCEESLAYSKILQDLPPPPAHVRLEVTPAQTQA